MKQTQLHTCSPFKQGHKFSIFDKELRERAKFESKKHKQRDKHNYKQTTYDVNLSDIYQQQEKSQHTILPHDRMPSLNPLQLKGLLFLILLTSAHAINAANKMNPSINDTPNKESESIQQKIYEICSSVTFATYNKPNITIDYNRGELIPRACAEHEFKYKMDDACECEKQKNTLRQFRADITKRKADFLKLDKIREKVNAEYKKWRPEAQKEIAKIQKDHSLKQQTIFNGIIQNIIHLSGNYYLAIYMREYKGGNCGEHSSDSLEKLLNFKMTHGLKMRIQLVSLGKSKPTSPYRDHEYILIDSDVPDVNIQQDVKKVGHFLDSMKKGRICDQWNKGYFADLASDNNGLYRSDAQWDELTIKTISLNFAEFDKLTKTAQRFICKQLSQIGLSVEPKEKCGIFKNIVTKNRESAGSVNSKLPKLS